MRTLLALATAEQIGEGPGRRKNAKRINFRNRIRSSSGGVDEVPEKPVRACKNDFRFKTCRCFFFLSPFGVCVCALSLLKMVGAANALGK